MPQRAGRPPYCPSLLHMDHTSPVRFGDFNRAVGRAIVGDDDFSRQGGFGEGTQRFVDADAEGVCFVQTGNDDRDFRCWCGDRRVRSCPRLRLAQIILLARRMRTFYCVGFK